MKTAENQGNVVIDLWRCLCTLSTNFDFCSHREFCKEHISSRQLHSGYRASPFYQEESQSHCAPGAALTGALVYSAMFYIQPRLQVSVSVDLWLISFEKGDRNVRKGLALIFIFRQIFTTLNNYQEKEGSAVNKLWTKNPNTIKIQTVRSGDCKGSVK